MLNLTVSILRISLSIERKLSRIPSFGESTSRPDRVQAKEDEASALVMSRLHDIAAHEARFDKPTQAHNMQQSATQGLMLTELDTVLGMIQTIHPAHSMHSESIRLPAGLEPSTNILTEDFKLVTSVIEESIQSQFRNHSNYQDPKNIFLSKQILKPRPIAIQKITETCRKDISNIILNPITSVTRSDGCLKQWTTIEGMEICSQDRDEADIKKHLLDSIWDDLINDTVKSLMASFN